MNPHRRAHLAAYGLFLLVALVITWPLVTVMGTQFAGFDFGDAHEMTRQIWWFKYAAQHGQPLIFQPLLAYPDGLQGVILWSDPLQFFPGWLLAFFMPLAAAYNLQALLNLALNGWAAYYLIWKLTDRRMGAVIAGVVFMAAPTMQGHLAGGHGGLLVQWPLPLLAYALIRLRRVRQNPEGHNNREMLRVAALATLFFVLLPFGHTLQLIYAAMPLLMVFGLTLLIERNWRGLGWLILAVGAGSVILLIFLLPVFQATFGTSAYTGEGGSVGYSIDLLAIVTPSFNHPLFGQLDYTHRVLGINIVEGSSYVGIVAGLLALVAIWKWRAARWWLVVGGFAWVLALGPLLKVFDQPISLNNGEYSTFISLPWALVADLPGLNLARTPGRFNFLLALAVAVLAGYGAARLLDSGFFKQRGGRWSYLVTVIVCALVLVDYQSFWPMPTYSAEIPAAVQSIATREDVRAVFNLPWDNLLAAKDGLWLQTAHEKPIIAGQVTRRTPVSPAKLSILQGTLDPALLNAAGADVVILHKTYDYDGSLGTHARDVLGEPFYEDARLAVWNVPETDADPPFTEVSEIPSEPSNRINLYFYTPEPGWIDLDTTLHIGEGHSASLVLDESPLRTEVADGEVNLSIPLDEAGYHTVSLALDNPCPETVPDGLSCNGLMVEGLKIGSFQAATFTPAVQFDRGVALRGSQVENPTPESESPVVRVNLWWGFDTARTEQDIRFIKILDSDGNPVAGVDESLGTHPAGSEWIESLNLPLADVLPGNYRVYVGWYSYPDLIRFPVLSDVPGAADGLALIGQFTVPED